MYYKDTDGALDSLIGSEDQERGRKKQGGSSRSKNYQAKDTVYKEPL